MRRIIALASVLLLGAAACTESSGTTGNGEEEAPQVSYENRDEPFELEIEAPEGWSPLEDGERQFPVSEEQQTYVFALDGGHEATQLIVSAYLLPEGTALSDYDGQEAFVLDHDSTTDNTEDPSNIYPTLVHRYEGVHRYYRSEGHDFGSLFQRHFFLFAGRHLIQITCQWAQNQEALVAGCQQLTQNFAFPEGWPAEEPAA